MAAPRVLLRPHFRTRVLSSPATSTLRLTHQQRRTFLPPFALPSNPLASASSNIQKLTATRTLPYPPDPIYAIISDVPSYSTFLPYCVSSKVRSWSAPDATPSKKSWPSEAELVVGFGSLTETFTSRVFCVPGKIVESIGGDARTRLEREEIAHHLGEGEGRAQGDVTAKGAGSGLLRYLSSRWTIEGLEGGRETRVTLALEYAFSNPVYEALSAGAAPRVAEVMIRAFEQRVKAVLDEEG